MVTNGNTDVYFTSGNSFCDTTTQISFKFSDISIPLKRINKDAYIVRTSILLPLQDDSLVHLFTSKFFPSTNPTDIAVLVKCKAFIIFPSLAEDIVNFSVVTSDA